MDSETSMKQELNLLELVTPNLPADTTAVRVTVYQMSKIDVMQIPQGTKLIHVGDVLALIVHGTLNYFDHQCRFDFNADPPTVQISTPVLKATPLGCYLVLATPSVRSGSILPDTLIEEQINNATSLLTAVLGRNIAFRHMYDQNMTGDKVTFASPVFENPHYFNCPDISDDNLNRVADVCQRIYALPTNDRNRFLLALRWFNAGCRESGIDGLIKVWTAIETLGMPDTTNIKPLNDCLCQIYLISLKDAIQVFRVGRIQGLRSDIVHNGYSGPLAAKLPQYVEALFVDILLYQLQMASEKRSLTFLDQHPIESLGLK